MYTGIVKVIPSYNDTTADYNGATVTVTATGNKTTNTIVGTAVPLSDSTNYTVPTGAGTGVGDWTFYDSNIRYTVSVINNPNYNSAEYGGSSSDQYLVTVLKETLTVDSSNTAAWPPRVCNTSDTAFMTGGHIDPAKKPTCIYVNDENFRLWKNGMRCTSIIRRTARLGLRTKRTARMRWCRTGNIRSLSLRGATNLLIGTIMMILRIVLLPVVLTVRAIRLRGNRLNTVRMWYRRITYMRRTK